MIDYKTITTPNGVSIKVPNQHIKQTKEQRIEELKQIYLVLIRDAKDLGEDEEVIRLQQEYQAKKIEIS